MDPISLGIGAIGLGMQLYGGISASQDAQRANQVQQDVTTQEANVNVQRQQAMELSARRQQMEVFRNTQRARAQGLNAATNQGASYGSGLQGGQAQATDQGLFNVAGINQNLQIGRNIFGLDAKISADKMQLSSIQADQITDQAWSGFGGALTKNAGTLANIGQYGAGQFKNGIDLTGVGFNPIKGVSG